MQNNAISSLTRNMKVSWLPESSEANVTSAELWAKNAAEEFWS
jgi:hypothetical protein